MTTLTLLTALLVFLTFTKGHKNEEISSDYGEVLLSERRGGYMPDLDMYSSPVHMTPDKSRTTDDRTRTQASQKGDGSGVHKHHKTHQVDPTKGDTTRPNEDGSRSHVDGTHTKADNVQTHAGRNDPDGSKRVHQHEPITGESQSRPQTSSGALLPGASQDPTSLAPSEKESNPFPLPMYAGADWYGGHKSPHPELDLFFNDCHKYDDDCLFNGPVCGSDNKTYSNYMHMSCLNHWRKPCDRCHVVKEGPCPQAPGKNNCKFSVLWKPVCASDNKTYANLEAMECHNKKFNTNLHLLFGGECHKPDPCFFDEYCFDKPVCGSNGRTYQSIQVLQCLRKIHNNLNVIHEGQCTSDDLTSVNATKSDLCKLARYTLEPFPVCASDGKTYHNIHYLMCYKPELTIEFNTKCDSHYHRACKVAEMMDDQRKSIPTCASDGHTYNSVHHILCASFVNRHLKVRHDGRCLTKDSPCLRQELDGRGSPVCGTDGVTYASFEHLACAQRVQSKKGILKYWHDGECLTNGHEGYFIL